MMNSTTRSSRSLSALVLGASLMLAPLGVAHAETSPATTESTSAQPSDSNLSRGERALTQTLSAEQPVASGRTEISAGHVDMGPRFNNGKFELMLHDDHGESPVWRSLDEVIYRGSDKAILEVPNDPRYSFVGAPAGSKVYVIPQTETKGVIWPGWNTQDPQLVSKLNRGVNLTLEQVSGPGTFSLYLENGNFSAPQVLWSSTKSEPQKLWVEKNTHTHANWVFTAPGEYLLKITASAELSDGSTVSDTRYLKFAVGDSASADTLYAMEAQARGSAGSASSGSASSTSQASGAQASGSSSAAAASDQSGFRAEFTISWGAIAAGVAAVIAVGAFLSFRRRSSAQREALDEVRGDRS
ncbi:choice-of-anchor M domain-containing protein [Rothia mucilaginosa]|uniref:choice-of-anchor M domain-containing protein n=1 Tax=Rothia mucilaginosa TaxID=43675 RepID=UPI0019590AE9|nr:choice-of-anchor M domain-containing protein [Rothia mucilaginosa]VTY06891.1 anch_rpt_wall: putative ABC transporter-associated repeat protein [Rothia mucilaginosa]